MDMGRDTVQDGVVELTYRPTRADVLVGLGVRERMRRLHLLRWGFAGFFLLMAVLTATSGRPSAFSVLVALFCAALIWGTPRFQARHALRTISWQGEYRATVGESGITVETAHATLVQRWSVFRGYRETRDHVVLLSRDPNILLVEVLPKRGLHSAEDLERLRALLDGAQPRV
ncbi:YcxB family protein [Streptomyces sp. NPDC002520]